MIKNLFLIIVFWAFSFNAFASECGKYLSSSAPAAQALNSIKGLNKKLYQKLSSQITSEKNNLDDLKSILIVLKKTELKYTDSYLRKGNNLANLTPEEIDFIITNQSDKFMALQKSDNEDITLFYTSRLRRTFLETVQAYKKIQIINAIKNSNIKELSPLEMKLISELLEVLNKDIHLLSEKSLDLEGLESMLANFNIYSPKKIKALLQAFESFNSDNEFSDTPTEVLLAAGFSWSELAPIKNIFKGNFNDSVKDLNCCGMMCRDCTFGLRWIK